MKILIVGGGGREHAITWKIAQNPKVNKIFCAPGNAGIAQLAECVPISATDSDALIAFAKQNCIDYTIIAPDDPLVLGVADAFEAANLAVFGPRKNAAIIEGSKAFSKAMMKKYNIPTARYETFETYDSALAYIKTQKLPLVVKADGLATGKGALVCQSYAEAETALKDMFIDQKFGSSGSTVVIEEFMSGREVTVLAFCDGKTLVPMISAQDHKRAYDDDKGLNTGGMGTIAPNPFYTDDIAEICMKEIFLPTIEAMKKEGRPFSGCLYFGLMLTKNGPRVIEYNCRFGDPETQVVLPLLETDLLEIFEAVYEKRLSEMDIKWKNGAAACVAMASGGYPEAYEIGFEINGLDDAETDKNITVYHAGTKLSDGKILTAGGRVLGITATGENLDKALGSAYSAVKKIYFKNAHYRKDIGRTF